MSVFTLPCLGSDIDIKVMNLEILHSIHLKVSDESQSLFKVSDAVLP